MLGPVMDLLPGGCHVSKAPDNTPLPYLVLDVGGLTGIEDDTSNIHVETRPVTFSIFTLDPDLGAMILDLLEAAFDLELDPPPMVGGDFAGTRFMAIYKEADDLLLDPDRTSEGDEVWMVLGRFNFVIQRDSVYV